MVGPFFYRSFYFLREALKGIINNRFIHLVATGTITFALLTFGMFIITVTNLTHIFNEWGEKVQVIAYLESDVDEQTVAKIREHITGKPQTEKAAFISKKNALTALKKSLQDHDGILENLDENPLPSSFEIQLKEEFKNPESIKTFAEDIKKTDKISDVEYGQEWLEKFSAFISLLNLVGISIGGFLLLATFLIISNTIKLTIYSRREEIEIMKLVGATNFFVRVPFFIEGILQGLTASLLSLCILYLCFKVFMSEIISVYSFYLGYSNFVFLSRNLIVSLIALGILLGVIGSSFSMGRFLKV